MRIRRARSPSYQQKMCPRSQTYSSDNIHDPGEEQLRLVGPQESAMSQRVSALSKLSKLGYNQRSAFSDKRGRSVLLCDLL